MVFLSFPEVFLVFRGLLTFFDVFSVVFLCFFCGSCGVFIIVLGKPWFSMFTIQRFVYSTTVFSIMIWQANDMP